MKWGASRESAHTGPATGPGSGDVPHAASCFQPSCPFLCREPTWPPLLGQATLANHATWSSNLWKPGLEQGRQQGWRCPARHAHHRPGAWCYIAPLYRRGCRGLGVTGTQPRQEPWVEPRSESTVLGTSSGSFLSPPKSGLQKCPVWALRLALSPHWQAGTLNPKCLAANMPAFPAGGPGHPHPHG